MIEQVMYFGIGFFAAALLGLLFVASVHTRAVRLTTKRIEAAIPLGLRQINADKDQIRARCAMSVRQLETIVERLKTKLAAHMSDITKKTDIIKELKKEFDKKDARILALETDEKSLRDELRAAEERFEVQLSAMDDAKRGKLQKLLADLDHKSGLLDEREREIERLRRELYAAHAINNDLSHKTLVARSRGNEVVTKLAAEVERLQSEPTTAVAVRAGLKQKIVAIQREAQRHHLVEPLR